ncbi:MAG TPA: hypothetical protein VGP82_20400 [Ktedonobacterales bacterium]|jgi:hypothetical protein|nr:hypothetical protein [Ktedonobacterales bacterium]
MEDKAASHQFRRPHYGDGDRLRVVQRGQHFGREGVVEGQPTPVTLTQGYVLTYLYNVRLDDGAMLDLAEELLAPLPE